MKRFIIFLHGFLTQFSSLGKYYKHNSAARRLPPKKNPACATDSGEVFDARQYNKRIHNAISKYGYTNLAAISLTHYLEENISNNHGYESSDPQDIVFVHHRWLLSFLKLTT